MNRMQRLVAQLYSLLIFVMLAFPPFQRVVPGDSGVYRIHRGWFHLLTPPLVSRLNVELLLVQFLGVTLALGALYWSLGNTSRPRGERDHEL